MIKKTVLLLISIAFLSSCGLRKKVEELEGQNKTLATKNSRLSTHAKELEKTVDYLNERIQDIENTEAQRDGETGELPVELVVLSVAEIMPQYRGEGNLYEYLEANLKSTSAITGTVYIEFVVDENGNLGQFKPVRSLDEKHDEESIRVIKSTSPWVPGRVGEQNVKVRMIVPIVFK